MTIRANLFRVNLGCGPHYARGWVNVDRYDVDAVPDGRTVDVIADLLELPFEAGSCGRVYMGHVIEHLTLDEEVPRALLEVRRVLAPDGLLMVVGPDVERAREGWPEMVKAIEPGEGDDALPKGIPHKWAPTGHTALEACRPVFPEAREIPVTIVPTDWPVVDRVGWQFAVECPA